MQMVCGNENSVVNDCYGSETPISVSVHYKGRVLFTSEPDEGVLGVSIRSFNLAHTLVQHRRSRWLQNDRLSKF